MCTNHFTCTVELRITQPDGIINLVLDALAWFYAVDVVCVLRCLLVLLTKTSLTQPRVVLQAQQRRYVENTERGKRDVWCRKTKNWDEQNIGTKDSKMKQVWKGAVGGTDEPGPVMHLFIGIYYIWTHFYTLPFGVPGLLIAYQHF